MGRAYWKNSSRTVGRTLSRFLAIFAIVALGVGFLAGLMASSDDMRLSADQYYDDTATYDFRVVATQGLTEDDLAAVRALEGVEAVLPARDRDLVYAAENGDVYTTRVHTLPREGDPQINMPVLVEGRFPERTGECVVVLPKSFVEEEQWIGQTLTLEGGEEDGVPAALEVVGTVKSALYLSMESERSTAGSGSVGLAVYTVLDSFDLDCYTTFYGALAGARELNSFGEAYEELSAAARVKLEELGELRAPIRYGEIVSDAEEKIADARREYEDKKAEANKQLADAEKELEEAQREIEENEKKLADGRQEIADGEAALEESRRDAEVRLAQAQAQIDDGAAQIAGYQAQINGGRAQLDAAQAYLDGTADQLAAGEAELAQAKVELDRREGELAALEAGKADFWAMAGQLGLPAEDSSDAATLAGIDQLLKLAPEAAEQLAPLRAGLSALAEQGTDTAAARAQLEAGKAAYEENLAQASAGRAELDAARQTLAAQRTALADRQAQLDAQRDRLEESAVQLAQSRAEAGEQLAQAEQELEDARIELADGEQKLVDGKAELADGWQEYEDSKAEADEKLADAEVQIMDAERELADLEEGEWFLFERADNVGFSSYASNADKIAAIARVFPAFFFLVAALVALTTMTRMVEEERQQVGALKALGYSSGAIAVKYLLYAGLASVLGSAAGLAAGMRIFPTIIIRAYNVMYDVPRAMTPFNVPYALLSSLTLTACTLLATLSACWAELRESPAALLLPKAPKAGKRVFLEKITPLWRRMKFTHKVAARNLIRYKKRFFMTVIGIAGCTALLVTGFGLRDSIFDLVDLQYVQLSHYQLSLYLSEESALDQPRLLEILEDEGQAADWLAVMDNGGKMVPGQGAPADDVRIMVPSDIQAYQGFFTFRHRTDDAPVAFGEDSVIITEKLAERQHLKVGDAITLKDQDERRAGLVVTDICENYVYHMVFLSPGTYERAFGRPPEWNTVLCQLPEGWSTADDDALAARLLECPGVAAAVFTQEVSDSFDNSIRSLNSIVLVLIFSAGALAFVVLYNLTNINISERVKEIATIKVLGFYDGEVSAYIYRENAVLTLIGTGIGLLLGIALHQFVVRTAEVDIVMFGRAVYPLSYVWSALLTIVFSVLVNLVMHRRLKKISMVESMKAPE